MTATLSPTARLQDPLQHSAGTPENSGKPPGRLARLWRGDPADPRWARPSMLSLLVATAVLYLYNVTASGTANTFYAAAVQAGTKSWKAFFFGSFDSANYITVDKPPASLWVMELSGRIFGFSSWSMLAPQAIEGVIAVGLVYGAVRRISGSAAGLAAGAMLALTPAAALMFDFNNPDALLVLLLVGAAYALVRALENGSTRWLLVVGTCIGFGVLTKMGQAGLVVPAFGLTYLIAGPPQLGKRLLQLLGASAALLVSAGWWVAAVELVPASERPFIGGSTDNSILNLIFGYNGLGRLFGGSGNGGGGGGGSTSSAFGGTRGLTRLFSEEMGLQISWLLPAALIAIVAGLWLTRSAPRTNLARAAIVMWGGWLVITGLVFSYMEGTIHPYYTVALAPAIAGLIATAATLIWQQRSSIIARLFAVAMTGATGAWSYHLLNLTPSWFPVLRYVALAATVLAIAFILGANRLSRAGMVAAAAVATVVLAGPGAYAIATTTVGHTGSTPTVGTTATSGQGGGAGGGFGGGAPSGTAPSGASGGPPSGSSGIGGSTSSSATGTQSPAGSASGATDNNSALTALLKASTAKWAAATSSSMTGASLELSSGKAVMAIGGFSGSDNAITLTQFKALVASGEIGYFVAGGGVGGGGGSTAYSQIASWVAANYTATTVGSTTVYDLTAAS